MPNKKQQVKQLLSNSRHRTFNGEHKRVGVWLTHDEWMALEKLAQTAMVKPSTMAKRLIVKGCRG